MTAYRRPDPKRSRRLIPQLLSAAALLTGGVGALLYFAVFWLRRAFGYVQPGQLLWHIVNISEQIDTSVLSAGVIAVVLMRVLLVLIGVTVVVYPRLPVRIWGLMTSGFSGRRRGGGIRRRHLPPWLWPGITLCAGLALLVSAVRHFDHEYRVAATFYAQDRGLLQAHYRIPAADEITFPHGRRSLVLVLGESLESSFGDPAADTDCIPNLRQLQQGAKFNANMRPVSGTSWTIGALTGWFFGLPLKVPFGMRNGDSYRMNAGFLPHAVSIFDYLRAQGYELEIVLGSDKRYSGKEHLFAHGGFRVLDKAYWQEHGWDLGELMGTTWGFNDEFTLARAHEEWQRLQRQGKPYVLLVETVDTHVNEFYCPPERQKFHDLRDSVLEMDRQLSAFARIIRADPAAAPLMIICGDHLFLNELPFIRKVPARRIYNVFLDGGLPEGDGFPPVPPAKQTGYFTALDMAPTLLQAVGARWGDDRFGLGVSLFAERPTLYTQLGAEKLTEILDEPSQFYAEFY